MRRSAVKRMCQISAFSVLTAGCATDLKASQLSQGPVDGLGYTLPFTQYAITLKWTVTSCDPVLEVTAKVDAAAGSAEDGHHAYTIDPQSLQTATSVASLNRWRTTRVAQGREILDAC